MFEENTNLSATSQRIERNQLTTISTRDESKDSLFEETASRTPIPPNLAQMDTKSQQKYVDSLIKPAIAHKIANRNEKTQERSHDSSLEITNDEASIATDQPNKSSRQEYINSIAEAAIAKTVADEKENKKSTLEESSDPLTGEEKENSISTPYPKGLAGEEIEEKVKQEGAPKVKNVGFVNYKWTEIFVEDDEECNSIDRDDVKKGLHTHDEEGGK